MNWLAIIMFFVGGAIGFFMATLVASSKLKELDANYRRLVAMHGGREK